MVVVSVQMVLVTGRGVRVLVIVSNSVKVMETVSVLAAAVTEVVDFTNLVLVWVTTAGVFITVGWMVEMIVIGARV
jgi:hypothetical protein